MHYGFTVNPKLGWKPALDGLRGFAVLAVMLRHFQYEGFNSDRYILLPGGGLGVDLFFVLSGFLITTLLLQEWATTRSISIPHFYMRRALRLLPAVVVFMVGFLIVTSFVETRTSLSDEVSTRVLITNVAAISTYSFNWFMAFSQDRIWGLGHLWSLSVEEQFYLVWPLLLLFLLRLRASPPAILGLSLAAFVASASLPFIWGNAGFDRFYFGADYRIHTLMVGCILAQLYVCGVLRPSVATNLLFKVAVGVSAACLILFAAGWRNVYVALFSLLTGTDRTFLFAGGQTVIALAGGFVLAGALFSTRGIGHQMLTNRVIVYIGKRSYALYLWHYAIGYWLRDLDAIPQILLSFAVSFLAADLSHRLVEAPALRLKGRFSSRTRESDLLTSQSAA